MKRYRRHDVPVLFLSLLCAALAVVGCDDQPTSSPSDLEPQAPAPPPVASSGRVRVAQLTEDGRSVDVAIDGVTVTRNLSYPGVAGYVELSEGEHRVQIFRAGRTGAAMVETTLFLPGGASRTVAVVGNDPVDLVVVDEDGASAPDGARVRLFNAVPDFPASLDLGIVNGPLIVTDVPFSRASAYASVVPGNYALVLKRGGTREEIATTFDVLPDSTNTTVFAVGTLARGDIELIVAPDAR